MIRVLVWSLCGSLVGTALALALRRDYPAEIVVRVTPALPTTARQVLADEYTRECRLAIAAACSGALPCADPEEAERARTVIVQRWAPVWAAVDGGPVCGGEL